MQQPTKQWQQDRAQQRMLATLFSCAVLSALAIYQRSMATPQQLQLCVRLFAVCWSPREQLADFSNKQLTHSSACSCKHT
jgi:hypothetical protein